MKLQVSHDAQPSAVTLEQARDYLKRDDAGLGAGMCTILAAGIGSHGAGPANYAALGRLVRAGIEAMGEEQAVLHVIEMMKRRRR